MRREALKTLLGLAVMASMAAGCGFQLRGSAQLPFESVWLDAPSASTLAPLLAQNLRLNGKKVLDRPEGAQLQLRLTEERRTKDILALSGGGKVREYRLTYQLKLSALNAAGVEVLPPSLLQTTRDFSFDDAQVLAKEAEEARLQRDMEQDMLRQVLRRLAFVKP